jgi:hypothetical protein
MYLGLIAAPLALFSGCGIALQLTASRAPTTTIEAIGRMAAGEVVAALFLVSCLALSWSLFAPQWVERIIERYVARLVVGMAAFVPVVFLDVWLV